MLRIELTTQLRRLRSLILFGALVALPVVAAATQRRGSHGPAAFSALNFAESALSFMDPVLFGLVIVTFGSVLGGADREWGTLRYLYVRPVTPSALLTGKWCALLICSVLTVVTLLAAALLSGYTAFGWHRFHRAGLSDLATLPATGALLGAGGYVIVCLLSAGSIALALGLVLPRSTEALAVSIAFIVASAAADGVPALHPVINALPVHYWMRWTQLFSHAHRGELLLGLVVQAATIAIAMTASYLLLRRRDPAA